MPHHPFIPMTLPKSWLEKFLQDSSACPWNLRVCTECYFASFLRTANIKILCFSTGNFCHFALKISLQCGYSWLNAAPRHRAEGLGASPISTKKTHFCIFPTPNLGENATFFSCAGKRQNSKQVRYAKKEP